MLHTTLIGPNAFSKVSKKQEVSLTPQTASHDVFWQILSADIRRRSATQGTVVPANAVLVINHCATNQLLSSDNKSVKNSFGVENEVCCHRFTDKHTKHNNQEVEECNLWALVTAPTGAHFAEMYDSKFKDTNATLQRVKNKLLQRAGNGGFRSLVRILKIMDDDGNRKLTKSELVGGLNTYGIFLDDQEATAVMRAFDRDGSETVSITEFLRELRGDLNPRRKELVLMAFGCLDKNRDGTVNMADMMLIYGRHIGEHPDVKSGAKSPEKVLLEFSSMWDKNQDGTVTEEEFLDYYADMSVNIDSDDYFELMIRNAWHLSGGEGWTENTTCRRVLVTHYDGSQTVEEIENDLGIGPNDLQAMREALMAQGILDIKRIDLTG
jgi:Ca2+-binding EF-hand superfamily protein